MGVATSTGCLEEFPFAAFLQLGVGQAPGALSRITGIKPPQDTGPSRCRSWLFLPSGPCAAIVSDQSCCIVCLCFVATLQMEQSWNIFNAADCVPSLQRRRGQNDGVLVFTALWYHSRHFPLVSALPSSPTRVIALFACVLLLHSKRSNLGISSTPPTVYPHSSPIEDRTMFC